MSPAASVCSWDRRGSSSPTGAAIPTLAHGSQAALDGAFLAMLFLTSATGLLLLALREGAAMPSLLAVHLVVVLALFVTLPYGKFVHGIYRAAALVKFRKEARS